MLVEVVVDVGLKSAVGFEDFVNGKGVFRCIFCGSGRFASDDEGHDVLGFDVLSFRLQTKRDLHGRHGVAIRVFLGVLAKLRVDGVLAGRDGILSHLL